MPEYTLKDIQTGLTEAQKEKIARLTSAFFAMACAIALQNNREAETTPEERTETTP